MSRPLTDEQREAIAYLLGRIPELAEEDIDGSDSLDGVFAPWVKLLDILTTVSFSYGMAHSDEDALQAARTVHNALPVRER